MVVNGISASEAGTPRRASGGNTEPPAPCLARTSPATFDCTRHSSPTPDINRIIPKGTSRFKGLSCVFKWFLHVAFWRWIPFNPTPFVHKGHNKIPILFYNEQWILINKIEVDTRRGAFLLSVIPDGFKWQSILYVSGKFNKFFPRQMMKSEKAAVNLSCFNDESQTYFGGYSYCVRRTYSDRYICFNKKVNSTVPSSVFLCGVGELIDCANIEFQSRVRNITYGA